MKTLATFGNLPCHTHLADHGASTEPGEHILSRDNPLLPDCDTVGVMLGEIQRVECWEAS